MRKSGEISFRMRSKKYNHIILNVAQLRYPRVRDVYLKVILTESSEA